MRTMHLSNKLKMILFTIGMMIDLLVCALLTWKQHTHTHELHAQLFTVAG